jgi:uncharacterized protein YndB with AHSA1/START domain
VAEKTDEGLAVRSTVSVPLPPEAAFRLFTEGMGGWWPLGTHSIFGAEATGIVVEPRVDGRVYEVTADGRRGEWGVVRTWQPGARFAMSWYPGNEPELGTHVEVRFAATAEGGTRVDLRHTGWESRGADAARVAASYDAGWSFVLGRYLAAA